LIDFLLFDVIKIYGAGGVPVGKKARRHGTAFQEDDA
jgi:hypothetical protein